MKVKGKGVFLSGPMTGRQYFNIVAFAEAHAKLAEMGARNVYNPALAWLNDDKSAERTHEDWMRACVTEMLRRRRKYADDLVLDSCEDLYDVVVQLPDWETSDGAVLEATVARACGIPCVRIEDCE